MEAGPVRAMVVHKNDLIRDHLADFLRVAGMEVNSSVIGLEELKDMALRWKPHIIIMDMRFINQAFPILLEDLKRQMDAKWALTGPEPYEYYAGYTRALGADLYFSEAQHPKEWLEGLNALVLGRIKTHPGCNNGSR
jgi:DNA-binding NarL/FixJ family response regulator